MDNIFKARALRGVPLLLLTALMVRAITFAEPLGDVIMGMQQRGIFSLNGVEVPLISSFYGIPVLDDVLAHTTVAFAQLQMYPADTAAYWQSLVFLFEYAGVYAILLLESCREVNRGTVFRYPFLVAFFGQFIPIGIVVPIWYFCAYIFTNSAKSALPASRAISTGHAAAVLPTVILAYYVPNYICYFHESYTARHWWNWIWQLYPVWGSAIFFVSTCTISQIFDVKACSSRSIIRLTIAIMTTINSFAYWYVVHDSGHSLLELFVPKYFIEAPTVPEVAMRVVIQYDYICSLGAVLIWLALSMRERPLSGSLQGSWSLVFPFVVLVSGTCGVGAMMLLGWLWMEERSEPLAESMKKIR